MITSFPPSKTNAAYAMVLTTDRSCSDRKREGERKGAVERERSRGIPRFGKRMHSRGTEVILDANNHSSIRSHAKISPVHGLQSAACTKSLDKAREGGKFLRLKVH